MTDNDDVTSNTPLSAPKASTNTTEAATLEGQQKQQQQQQQQQPLVSKGAAGSASEPTTSRDQNCSRDANSPQGLANRLEQLSVSPPRLMLGVRDSTPPASRVISTIQSDSSPIITQGDTMTPRSQQIMAPRGTPTASGLSSPVGLPRPATGSPFVEDASLPASSLEQHQLHLRQRSGRPAPSRGYDLTPVIRNTSSADDKEILEDDILSSMYAVVSPDDCQLSFPSNFASGPLPSCGPSIPPLPSKRSKSVGQCETIQVAPRPMPSTPNIPPPCDFPTSRKHCSFTSRKQYEQRLPPTAEDGADIPVQQLNTHDPHTQRLTPYQPTRENFVGDVLSLPHEEVSRIFITRRVSTATADSSSSNLAPFPLEERQWSIPSIRMANHLNGSIASYTSCTDEEDFTLQGGTDDDTNSLSSRGSLFMPDSIESAEPFDATQAFAPSITFTVEQWPCNDTEGQTSVLPCSETVDATDGDARERRRKKRSKMEQNAVEWLRTVEASDDVFAEAASSKFLTGNAATTSHATRTITKQSFPTSGVNASISKAMLRRQESSPATLDTHGLSMTSSTAPATLQA